MNFFNFFRINILLLAIISITFLLPIGVAVTAYEPLESREATRSVAEAQRLAVAELNAQIAADGTGRKLLSRTVETVSDDTGVRLLCTLVCEEDIAVVREAEEIPTKFG